jgi:hypothetical protein
MFGFFETIFDGIKPGAETKPIISSFWHFFEEEISQ